MVAEDLTTARLTLRPYTPSELPAFLDLALDPRVTRLVGDGSPWTAKRATARFAAGLSTHQAG
jgi:RimJ/RimL family protein N-acetyltransferase